MFAHMVAEGFLSPEHQALLLVDDDPGRLVARLRAAEPPAVTDKWRGRSGARLA